jgi:hypothetical protein
MTGLVVFNVAVVLLVVAVVGHDPRWFLALAQQLEDYPMTCWGYTQQPANASFAAVWSNNQAFCGMHSNRSSTCWGDNTFGQVSPTPALPPPNYFASFGVGAYHTCAVVDNGTAVCWGRNSNGETTPPAGADFTVVVSGAYSSCGLLANQSVVCWGKYASPAGDLRFAQLAHLAEHPCGVLANGTAICWGTNLYNSTVVPEGLLFKQVGVGNANTCGLLTNGTALCWGINQYGQGNVPDGEIFESIHVGWAHVCGLRSNNTIRCWGLDSGGVVNGPNSWPDLTYEDVILNSEDTCGLLFPPSPTPSASPSTSPSHSPSPSTSPSNSPSPSATSSASPSASPAGLVSNATIGQSMPQLQFDVTQPKVAVTPTGTPTVFSFLALLAFPPFSTRPHAHARARMRTHTHKHAH